LWQWVAGLLSRNLRAFDGGGVFVSLGCFLKWSLEVVESSFRCGFAMDSPVLDHQVYDLLVGQTGFQSKLARARS